MQWYVVVVHFPPVDGKHRTKQKRCDSSARRLSLSDTGEVGEPGEARRPLPKATAFDPKVGVS